MRFLAFILRHIIPIGAVSGAGILFLTAAVPVNTGRIDGIGMDLTSSPPHSEEDIRYQMNVLDQTDAEIVQIEMNWNAIESTPDVYDWSAAFPLDAFLTAAESQGITTVAVMNGQPDYLFSSGSELDQQVFLDRWSLYVQAAVDHFGDRVDIWQIGSNINSNTSRFPSLSSSSYQPDPALYSHLLTSADKIIKKADANNEVWMGSLVSPVAGNCAMNPLTFLLEIHAAKGWNHADAVTYQPLRGATAPEYASAGGINPACGSTLQSEILTLSDEVTALQELLRQLGGKPLHITGLNWSEEELQQLGANRSLLPDQLEADLLVRASALIFSRNNIELITWQIDPATQSSAINSMTNLNTLLHNAKSLGQAQNESLLVQDHRFQKSGKVILLAWVILNGDAPQTVNLADINSEKLLAYPADAVKPAKTDATTVPVDGNGFTVLMLNERPVILSGRSGDLPDQIDQTLSDQLDILKISIEDTATRWLNNQKTAALSKLEEMLIELKDEAIIWGKEKINEIFQ